jgi:hypothetical protein
VIRLPKTLLLTPTALVLSGCVIAVDGDGWDERHDDDWERRQTENRRAIDDLALGTARDAVEARLGPPDLVESFRRDGHRFVVLRYRTQRVHGDGETTREETTPVVFVDDELVGWGESAVAHATAGR